MTIKKIGQKAKEAKFVLATAKTADKDAALIKIADFLVRDIDYIISENKKDIDAAKENGTTKALIDRLMLNEKRVHDMAEGARDIAKSSDPVGRVLSGNTLKNGLRLQKVAAPLGVIAVIYEARPNVTADAAALCIKSGNAVILRGGKEAINSNKAIVKVMREAVQLVGLPADIIGFIEDTSRESATELMRLNEYVDVLIPRGGAGLIKSCVENAAIPVIETGTGNCHIYVDENADTDMAVDIIVNAKTTRVSVCNSCESLVIHENMLKDTLPVIADALKNKGVELRCDEKSLLVLPDEKKATEEDFHTEYLDYIVSVKTVSNIDEAISHINKYGTGHSDAIITNSLENANKFTSAVDSAAVYVNTSTRFTDGGEFGFGAEIGISTQKLHARGPLGLNDLTSAKYVVYGDGQIRE